MNSGLNHRPVRSARQLLPAALEARSPLSAATNLLFQMGKRPASLRPAQRNAGTMDERSQLAEVPGILRNGPANGEGPSSSVRRVPPHLDDIASFRLGEFQSLRSCLYRSDGTRDGVGGDSRSLNTTPETTRGIDSLRSPWASNDALSVFADNSTAVALNNTLKMST
jgi:hypothetical protein